MELFNTDTLKKENIESFCDLCHEAAKTWWVDPKTNEPLDRNRGEMIALKHSELSEAWDAHMHNAHDDHLPHREGYIVEIADACIRLGGYIGRTKIEIIPTDNFYAEHLLGRLEVLGVLHSLLSNLLEAERKGGDRSTPTYNFFKVIHQLKHLFPDLDTIIVEKMEYNAQRADHKLENRIKPDGKKF